MQNQIKVRGAREHNLQNVSVDIPKNQFVCMTGVSGSGKSSLAFDTIYAEGQRRYVESLSSYARQFLGLMDKPDVDEITGLFRSIKKPSVTTLAQPLAPLPRFMTIYGSYLRGSATPIAQSVAKKSANFHSTKSPIKSSPRSIILLASQNPLQPSPILSPQS